MFQARQLEVEEQGVRAQEKPGAAPETKVEAGVCDETAEVRVYGQ